MSISFKPAVKEQTPLLIGIVGPSGGGKSYSALRLATGIQQVVGGEIFGIDSEAGRMLHYAERFKFQHADFRPPFSSLNYLDAFQTAVKLGGKIIIMDSMSHEHEGTGGYKDLHEKELDRLAGKDNRKREQVKFLSWAKPAEERRALINGILQLPACFIFCFRAKDRLQLVRDEQGKTKPVPIGWQAIAGKEFVYEMVCRFLLPPGANGVPDWSKEAWAHGVPKLSEDHKPLFHDGRALDEAAGIALAEWSTGKKIPETLPLAPGTAIREKVDKAIKEAKIDPRQFLQWLENGGKVKTVAGMVDLGTMSVTDADKMLRMWDATITAFNIWKN